MDKKSARKSDSSEKESDDADRSSNPTQEEEATDSQSEEPDSPAGNVRKAGGSGAVQASAVGGTPSGQKAQSHSSGEGYVNYERGSDPGALSARYGMDVRDAEAGELQRLEREFGRDRVSRWAREGMTVDTMGRPRDMQAFRTRQEERSEEIPTDIERRNEASLQRNASGEREDSPAGETGVPDVVRSVVSSPGRSMDETVQREMESKMGSDFSDVQLHTGPKATAAADSINARAFTVGNHVAFNKGEYQPDSDSGKRILAHELTHVRQQTEGAVTMLPKPNSEPVSVQRSVAEGVLLQPKLEVSSPDDPAEKEAEDVAAKIVEMDSSSQKQSEDGASEQQPQEKTTKQETETVIPSQSASVSSGGEVSTDSESTVRSGVRGGGKSLPSKVQSNFESRMGADFSDVSVHTGPKADRAAKSINAQAYTIGSDIAFSKGRYNPDSKSGKKLLAHELTHVAQQTGGVNRQRQQMVNGGGGEEPVLKTKEGAVLEFHSGLELKKLSKEEALSDMKEHLDELYKHLDNLTDETEILIKEWKVYFRTAGIAYTNAYDNYQSAIKTAEGTMKKRDELMWQLLSWGVSAVGGKAFMKGIKKIGGKAGKVIDTFQKVSKVMGEKPIQANISEGYDLSKDEDATVPTNMQQNLLKDIDEAAVEALKIVSASKELITRLTSYMTNVQTQDQPSEENLSFEELKLRYVTATDRMVDFHNEFSEIINRDIPDTSKEVWSQEWERRLWAKWSNATEGERPTYKGHTEPVFYYLHQAEVEEFLNNDDHRLWTQLKASPQKIKRGDIETRADVVQTEVNLPIKLPRAISTRVIEVGTMRLVSGMQGHGGYARANLALWARNYEQNTAVDLPELPKF